MKQIEVVAAIIRKEDKIFATQRGYGEQMPQGQVTDMLMLMLGHKGV